jgi:hypothetical protein
LSAGAFQEPSTTTTGRKLLAQEVKPFFLFIEKALRAVSLYDENHPLLSSFIQEFVKYLNQATQKIQGDYVLHIQKHQALYEGEVIYDGPKDHTNMALLFYNGTLSSLSFKAGINEAELKKFLMALAQSRSRSSTEASLNNILWDLNLEYISCSAYDELTSYDRELPDLTQFQEKSHYLVPKSSSGISSQTMEASNFYNLLSEEEMYSEFTLTDTEGALLEEDIGLSESPAIQFVWAALQLFDVERDPRVFTNILRTIRTRLRVEVEEGQFANAALMIQQIESAKMAFSLTPSQIGEMTQLIQNLVDSELLQTVLNRIPHQKDLNAQAIKVCFRYVPLPLMPILIPLLGYEHSREIFQDLFKEAFGKNTQELLNYLKHEDPKIVIAVCKIVKEIGDRQALTPLRALIHNENTEIKKAALDALYKLFPKETMDMFITKLSDTDKKVRKIALENLPQSENKQVYLKILSIVESSAFEEFDFIEKREFLVALALCGQLEALALLQKIIEQQSFGLFLRKTAQTKQIELKKCAVKALAYIKDPNAAQLLKEIQGNPKSHQELQVMAQMALAERSKLNLS